MKYRVLVTVLTCFLCFSNRFNNLYSQDVTIEEINRIIHSGTKHSVKNVQENINLLNRIDSLSRSIGYSEGIVYSNLGLAANYRGKPPQVSKKYINVLDSLLLDNPSCFSDTTLVHYYLFKGVNSGAFGDEVGELNYYLKADSFASSINNEFLLAGIDHNISHFYFKLGEFENALVYNQRLVMYYGKMINPMDEFYYLLSTRKMGEIYLELNEPDSCVYYVSLAIELGLSNYESLCYSHLLLGKAYLNLGELEQARYYGELCESAECQNSLVLSIGSIHLFLGDLNIALGEFSEARNNFELLRQCSDSTGDMVGQREASFKLIYVDLLKRNEHESLQNLELYKLINDSLNDHATQRLKHQLLAQFETGKKELEISRLEYQEEISKKKRTYVIFSTIILLLVAGLIIYRNIIKRKIIAAELMNTKLAKKTLQSELSQTVERIKEKTLVINQLKSELENQSNENIEQMTEILNRNYVDESNWTKLIYYYDQLNDKFTEKVKLKSEKITKNDLILLILVKLSYSNKDIAVMRNITESGVKKGRQRLMQKLEISEISKLNI